MTNAERQRRYRKRQLQELDSPRMRLNTDLRITAKSALTRLARHYAVTEKVMLERLIANAESTVVAGLSGAAQKEYYDVTA